MLVISQIYLKGKTGSVCLAVALAEAFRGLVHRHWKVLVIILTAILALALGFYAIWSYINPLLMPHSVVALSGPLQLRLELDKTWFRRGEIVVVRISLQNMGDKNITLSFLCYAEQSLGRYGFLVKDVDDTIVHREGTRDCFMAVKNQYLPAGNKTEHVFQWDQTGNKLPSDEAWVDPPVPFGNYEIAALTLPYEVLETGTWNSRLETPPITITIFCL